MGSPTYVTGIPLITRKITPPPIPVTSISIHLEYTGTGNPSVIVTIIGDNGYTINAVNVSTTSPVTFNNVPYGNYLVTVIQPDGYNLDSTSPPAFIISASNPQQDVLILISAAVGSESGTITITKVITGGMGALDPTFYKVTITGQMAVDPTVIEGWVSQQEPLIFYEVPFDDYIIEEEGFSVISITPSSVTLNIENPTATAEIINEVFAVPISYGFLYNWWVASNPLIAPVGWHVPTREEWFALSDSLGGDLSITGGMCKTIDGWFDTNVGATNSSGFSAVPSGMRAGVTMGGQTAGDFQKAGKNANYWGNTDFGGYSQLINMTYENASLGFGPANWNDGYAIRFVKDDSIDPGTVTDFDGNVYNTKKIGDMVWTIENLRVTHLNDGTAIPNVPDTPEWIGLVTEGYCLYILP